MNKGMISGLTASSTAGGRTNDWARQLTMPREQVGRWLPRVKKIIFLTKKRDSHNPNKIDRLRRQPGAESKDTVM